MSQKNWFILNKVSQLHKLQKLLKEIPFIEMSGESIYLRLGYKILSPAEKETYYFMRDLTLFSRYKFEEKFSSEEISPSLDYLATCLGTNTKTQSERIAKFANSCPLIKITG